jgi:peroxiredoxin family protein
MAGPQKLSIVVFSGDHDRVHYALVMASAAAAIGRRVTLFFTMEATRALTPGWADPAMEASHADKGIATFEELLAACVELDVTFMVCEMGRRAAGVDPEGFRDDVPIEEGGAVTFLNDASADGAMLFV